MAAYITNDLSRHDTIEQLAQQFDISATALKKCFCAEEIKGCESNPGIFESPCLSVLFREVRYPSGEQHYGNRNCGIVSRKSESNAAQRQSVSENCIRVRHAVWKRAEKENMFW